MKTSTTIYLVKFDLGYYATKQPNYEWSYTDDIRLAARYKTLDKAEARGKWGCNLQQGFGKIVPSSYEIVTCEVTELITVVS